MANQITILNAAGKFDQIKSLVHEAVTKSISKLSESIEIDDLDIVVIHEPKHVIKEVGAGGHAANGNLLFIYLDVDSEKLEHAMEVEIHKTILHEAHHCLRHRGPGYGETLFEALISEGLADHFEIEITGDEPPKWSTSLSQEELLKAEEKAKDLYSSTYNHSEWFFGSGSLKKWTGYSLGFYLVSNYLKETKSKASELYATPAAEFESVIYGK